MIFNRPVNQTNRLIMKRILARKFLRLKLSENLSYRELTTLGIGSFLPLLAEPGSTVELAELIRFLSGRKIPFFLFGAGTNIVGMDAPYPGVGIRLDREGFSDIEHSGNGRFVCGAFARLSALCSAAAEAGYGGITPLVGIPGSLGGAVRMNAGANQCEIGSFVTELKGVRGNGSPWNAGAGDIVWKYRSSSIPADVIITSITFELPPSPPETARAEISAELAARREREPSGRSAGCAFRNPSDLEPAGMLIDRCGLRGFPVGDVSVSSRHANYLMNNGSGTEADYIRLIRIIRRTVAEKYGFYLRLETVAVNPELPRLLEDDLPSPMVNVVCGGNSSEREVSLRSGAAIAAALERGGFRVTLSDIKSCAVTPEMLDCDVVYIALHGGFGEGGALQELLEERKLRFVGSGSAASKLAINKISTKRLLDIYGLPTARWTTVTPEKRDFPENLRLPLAVKAPCEGSSVGIEFVHERDQWEAVLERLFKFSDELLVEEFISGVEITVPILNGEALEAVEIRSPHGFYDYDAKYIYKNGHTEYFCPPERASAPALEKAKQAALSFYRAAGCRDLLRVDFIISDADDTPYILEGNTIPGCTATSLVPKSARAAGISFERMTCNLVRAALLRTTGLPGRSVPPPAPTVNRALLFACRWLLRLAVVLAAVMLAGTGMLMLGNPEGFHSATALFVSAVLLLVTEPLSRWFASLAAGNHHVGRR